MSEARRPGPARRGVGRPRADPTVGSDNPSEDILDAAAALFCSVGYASTTTRQLAAAVGLRLGSLFHYFARKEDLLAELLDRTVEPAMSFVAWLDRVDAPPDIALTTLIRADATNLASLPHNLGTLILLPESHAERFAPYWEKRRWLRDRYRALLNDAHASGAFQVTDIETTTDLTFSTVESVISWFPVRSGLRPDKAAASVVEMVLRSLLARRSRLETVMAASTVLLLRAADEDRAGTG